MATVQEQLRLIGLSLSHAAAAGDLEAVHKWAVKAIVLTSPEVDAPETYVSTIVVDPSYFVEGSDDTVYLTGGTAAGNPNGATFTLAGAVAWWKGVFGAGLNISKVRPTLLPGSKVLTAKGLAAAQELGRTSVKFAPEDYNPLGLPVIP